MSKEILRALLALARDYRKNKPRVQKRLRRAGIKKADSAVVFTAARYFDCLDRLAKE